VIFRPVSNRALLNQSGIFSPGNDVVGASSAHSKLARLPRNSETGNGRLDGRSSENHFRVMGLSGPALNSVALSLHFTGS